MPNDSTILLIGISGVGKSHLAISAISKLANVVHVKASQLLKEELAAQAEALRLGSIQENQSILVTAFRRKRQNTTGTLLLDSHTIIDGREGIEVIPFAVFEAFEPKAMVAVYDEPQIIAERRNSDLSRTRPQRTAKQLEEHQARSEKVGAEYATRLNIPFIRVRAGDAQALADAICSLTGNVNHLIAG
jgi:adenylate kinase